MSHSKSEWVNQEGPCEYLIFLPRNHGQRPIALVMDQHLTYLSSPGLTKAEELSIRLIFVPRREKEFVNHSPGECSLPLMWSNKKRSEGARPSKNIELGAPLRLFFSMNSFVFFEVCDLVLSARTINWQFERIRHAPRILKRPSLRQRPVRKSLLAGTCRQHGSIECSKQLLTSPFMMMPCLEPDRQGVCRRKTAVVRSFDESEAGTH
jgi:hypothetical protein